MASFNVFEPDVMGITLALRYDSVQALPLHPQRPYRRRTLNLNVQHRRGRHAMLTAPVRNNPGLPMRLPTVPPVICQCAPV